MPLSEAQRRHLETRLRVERARAQTLLDRSLAEWAASDEQERAGDLSTRPFHPADLGTDTIDDEVEVSNATRISRELAEIDAALARLIETPDRFGRCADSGREIPFERLDIVPWAHRCPE
ncbi:MAG: hypothetical protein AVDCRST_MAG79-2576 [uncultured Thermoleophilia bacterium]|uniref:Zinc finger DksA/TraR C4-type domain-containing protein n=1 Tax=uncultured Thermoleophilia bacterium TaxID=1497501 RepID=A0A6J4UI54_9ACTN|nr:MAG: hypothetical protein AVDCRST_MAG79-2576 [uncultured Thermoleophilia bacterium]